MLAPCGGFSAASVNYGTATKEVYSESVLDAACPIVGSYGAKDRANRGTAQRLEQVLTADGVDHDIKTYPEAGHSFLNDHDIKTYPEAGHSFLNDHDAVDIPALFAVLGRLTGSKFHEPSAIDARRRIVEFFDRI
jgi:carboxymethylenebutenolidase